MKRCDEMNHQLDCDGHPAICDCSFHENARRAAATHPPEPCSSQLDNDPPRCSQCGRLPPLHAKHCPTITLAEVSRTAAALSELAGIGSDVCTLLAAVQEGATLVLTGPGSHDRRGAPRFGASLESADGAREAHAMGDDLPRLLGDLVKCWRSPASMINRVSPAVSR